MTTTAYDDQFHAEPERQAAMPSKEDFLRTNEAAMIRAEAAESEAECVREDNHGMMLEIHNLRIGLEQAEAELKSARDDLQSWIDSRNGWMERAHAAEQALKAAREQEPAVVIYVENGKIEDVHDQRLLKYMRDGIMNLYASPIPAPAVPDITDDVLREEMNAAVMLAADEEGIVDGKKAMRGFANRILMTWGTKEGMYLAFRDAVTAPVPEEWRDLVVEVSSVGYHDMPTGALPCSCSQCDRTRRARALLQSAGVKK